MNVTALIVTWNRLPQLKNTIKATLALPFSHIVIVNNGSTDGTREWLESLEEPRISLVHAYENLGGSEGFFLGSEYVSRHINTDWVVFYDDDAWPAEDFFEEFLKLDVDTPSVICAKVVDCNGNICQMNLPWRKRTVSLRDNLNYIRCPEDFAVHSESQSEVITCSFVGAIIHADLLKKTYLHIHRELFIYFDDVYYGYYLYLSGYRLHYQPSIKMYHDIGGRPVGNIAAWKIYYLVRNMLLSRCIFKNDSFFTPVAILFRVTKYFLLVLKNKNRLKSVKLIIRAIKDGLNDKRTPLDQ
ncbi:glycosyltransferase [Rosenbergiella collisarenosi]|uniref:glycosyltransferase n=1 Tax=Rosenbergiella collisarenosi TaxID=1544695 RepID=UPI001F502A4A|nr:glycosyltransferase [Rosenbergiella collisarenosi]